MTLRFLAAALACLLAASLPVLAQAQAGPRAIRPVDTAYLAQARRWAATITADELRALAFDLAADVMEGRETGTDGQVRAARYIAARFAELGLPRVGADYSYSQPIAFERASWDRVRLAVEGEQLRHLRDFYGLPAEASAVTATTDRPLFLGYGIDAPAYSDYRGAGDVRGRVGVVLAGEPYGKTGLSRVTGAADTSAWSRDAALKRAAAERAGLAALLIVEPDIQAAIASNRSRVIENELRIVPAGRTAQTPRAGSVPTLHVSPRLLRELSDDDDRGLLARIFTRSTRKRVVRARERMAAEGVSEPVDLRGDLALDLQPNRFALRGENVLGYFRGTDPALADELIVVSAHYDHLGKRGEAVYNGADDNASGTSTVLEIAEALAEATRAGEGPRRSVLVLLVSGEEKGLLGSAYYAANPVFPLEQTIANVNIDMIGRYDEAHADSAAYIYVIGAGRISPDLDSVTRAVGAAYTGLDLDYTFDAEDDPNRFYYRSDHYNFARNGVPAVFFFSGVHEDYHRPTDTPDKLDYAKMELVGRHAFAVLWNLANRDAPLNRK